MGVALRSCAGRVRAAFLKGGGNDEENCIAHVVGDCLGIGYVLDSAGASAAGHCRRDGGALAVPVRSLMAKRPVISERESAVLSVSWSD